MRAPGHQGTGLLTADICRDRYTGEEKENLPLSNDNVMLRCCALLRQHNNSGQRKGLVVLNARTHDMMQCRGKGLPANVPASLMQNNSPSAMLWACYCVLPSHNGTPLSGCSINQTGATVLKCAVSNTNNQRTQTTMLPLLHNKHCERPLPSRSFFVVVVQQQCKYTPD